MCVAGPVHAAKARRPSATAVVWWENTTDRFHATSSSQEELAERGGFEPPVPLRVHHLSKVTQSAALPPLRRRNRSRAAPRCARNCESSLATLVLRRKQGAMPSALPWTLGCAHSAVIRACGDGRDAVWRWRMTAEEERGACVSTAFAADEPVSSLPAAHARLHWCLALPVPGPGKGAAK